MLYARKFLVVTAFAAFAFPAHSGEEGECGYVADAFGIFAAPCDSTTTERMAWSGYQTFHVAGAQRNRIVAPGKSAAVDLLAGRKVLEPGESEWLGAVIATDGMGNLAAEGTSVAFDIGGRHFGSVVEDAIAEHRETAPQTAGALLVSASTGTAYSRRETLRVTAFRPTNAALTGVDVPERLESDLVEYAHVDGLTDPFGNEIADGVSIVMSGVDTRGESNIFPTATANAGATAAVALRDIAGQLALSAASGSSAGQPVTAQVRETNLPETIEAWLDFSPNGVLTIHTEAIVESGLHLLAEATQADFTLKADTGEHSARSAARDGVLAVRFVAPAAEGARLALAVSGRTWVADVRFPEGGGKSRVILQQARS